MKRFLLKVGIFFLGVTVMLYLLFLQADGYTDSFYLRFTSNKQNSLIIGTSRSAQGINPDIINTELGRNDIYNYSFTVSHSPFGETYLRSIKDKLDPFTKDGIFIVAVDPWSVSSITKDPNDSLNFRELDLCLNKVSDVNMDPNIEYLLNSYNKSYINLFKKDSRIQLHENGWLEVNVDMNQKSIENRFNKKIEYYLTEMLPYYTFSESRFRLFKKTIDYLKSKGRVYLVRLPIHYEIKRIEYQMMPEFESKINKYISEEGINYIDFNKTEYSFQFTDGNHLYKESGNALSGYIVNWIKYLENNERREER